MQAQMRKSWIIWQRPMKGCDRGIGSGNYNRKWMKTMEKLAEKGTVFVRASRVSQGIVFDDRVFDPMDVCIGANTLSGQKARVLLMLALTITKDVKQIRNIFNQY